MTYSVAIRTLGTAGDKYREELLCLHRQTIMPEKIVVYIAEGYKIPEYRIGIEEYVYVPKGMVAQRALSYTEIDSDCILMLDDDVRLAPDSAEKLLKAMMDNCADCVGADTFKNQEMSVYNKIYAFITNLVYPRLNDKWAFKICHNGAFSYNNHPKNQFYLSQSCAGPAAMWKKDSFLAIHYEDELWMEKLEYPHGNDFILFYKLYKNNYVLGVLYGSGIEHLDAAVSSTKFRNNKKRFYFRAKSPFAVWYRAVYSESKGIHRGAVLLSYMIRIIWMFIINIISVGYFKNVYIPYWYIKGIYDGYRFVQTEEFRTLPPYVLK